MLVCWSREFARRDSDRVRALYPRPPVCRFHIVHQGLSCAETGLPLWVESSYMLSISMSSLCSEHQEPRFYSTEVLEVRLMTDSIVAL